MTTPRVLGMMCRARMRAGPAPNARLASTNGRWRSESTCPRTMRAIVSHETAPRPKKRNSRRADFPRPGEPMAVSQFFKTPSSVVMRTMTKIIEGNE